MFRNLVVNRMRNIEAFKYLFDLKREPKIIKINIIHPYIGIYCIIVWRNG